VYSGEGINDYANSATGSGFSVARVAAAFVVVVLRFAIDSLPIRSCALRCGAFARSTSLRSLARASFFCLAAAGDTLSLSSVAASPSSSLFFLSLSLCPPLCILDPLFCNHH
jgi:hypothetical protein